MRRGLVRVRGIAMVAVLVVLGAYVALSAERPPGVSGPPLPVVAAAQTTLPEELLDGHSYSEALGPVNDGLSEVSLYVDTNNHHRLAALQMLLVDSGQVVRRSLVAEKPTSDLARFAFAPITDSGRRQLVAVVTAPGADQQTAITVFVVRDPGPGIPRLSRDSQDTGDFMPLRLRYGSPRSLAGQLVAVSDRASQYRPGWLKTPVPLLVAALALALSAALMAAVVGLGSERSDG